MRSKTCRNPKRLKGLCSLPLRPGLSFFELSRCFPQGYRRVKQCHQTPQNQLFVFRVARYSFLLVGCRVRDLWRKLKICRIPFFQTERLSSFSFPKGRGFSKHSEFKHVLEQVVLLGPGYSCFFSSVLGSQAILPVHRRRFSPPVR